MEGLDTAVNKDKSTVIELKEIEKSGKEFDITLDKTELPLWGQSTPQNPNSQPPPSQNYYYVDQGYNRGQTPVYQERLDGQSVYYAGGAPPPSNVSRGGTVYYINNPNRPDDAYYRNEDIFVSHFDSVKIRNRFVQRVYTILSVQLLVTFGFIILVVYENNTRTFFRKNRLVLFIVSMILFVVLYISLVCCEVLRRKFPLNFVMLGLLTITMTVLLSTVSAYANTKIVMYAIATTAGVCLLVSIFAIQTRWDVTGCGMCLCIAMMVLMLFGLIIMIMSLCGLRYRILDIVYSSLAALLFCFYLMYDTQKIVGGRRIEMSPEEYIFGALCLYIDIVYIFMHILMLWQLCGGQD